SYRSDRLPSTILRVPKPRGGRHNSLTVRGGLARLGLTAGAGEGRLVIGYSSHLGFPGAGLLLAAAAPFLLASGPLGGPHKVLRPWQPNIGQKPCQMEVIASGTGRSWRAAAPKGEIEKTNKTTGGLEQRMNADVL